MKAQLLTVGEAARILNRSAQSVRLYEQQGILPALRTEGGMRLFEVKDVERLKEGLKQVNRRKDD